MKFMNEKCFTVEEIRNDPQINVSPKMFGFFRTEKLIPPPPFKVGSSGGVTTYYPESVFITLKEMMAAKKEGLTYKEIGEKFSQEIERLFENCNDLKNKFEAYKRVKRESSNKMRKIETRTDGEDLNVNVSEKINVTDAFYGEIIENLKLELQKDFRNCNFSMKNLISIKRKISNIEKVYNEKEAKKIVKAELTEI
jgi:DNA-binding transcriptional MerR regulator